MIVRALVFVLVSSSFVFGSANSQSATPAGSPAAGGIFEARVATGDGSTLYLACAGSGAPPVLFEWGGPNTDGAATAIIAALGPDLAAALGTRFCAYDRAGTSQSAPAPGGVRTMRDAAADLNAVLVSPDLGCPCVVVGASLGGAIALEALAADATGFGGLVLLDALYPGYFDDYQAVAPADSAEATAWLDLARGNNPERLDLITGFRHEATPSVPASIPVIVVTHGAGEPPPCQGGACAADFPVSALEMAWQAGQSDLAATLGARYVVATGVGHAIADEDPELALELTADVIAAVREPGLWATPAP
jgi:pimeloyl-ACP methyl ester carboxylesterase